MPPLPAAFATWWLSLKACRHISQHLYAMGQWHKLACWPSLPHVLSHWHIVCVRNNTAGRLVVTSIEGRNFHFLRQPLACIKDLQSQRSTQLRRWQDLGRCCRTADTVLHPDKQRHVFVASITVWGACHGISRFQIHNVHGALCRVQLLDKHVCHALCSCFRDATR